MVTSSRIQMLSDKSDEISILKEFLTDPNLCAKLEAEVKKLNTLSAEEELRHQEAKIFSQQRDQLSSDVEKLQQNLEDERIAHDESLANSKKNYENWFESEKKKIDSANAELEKRTNKFQSKMEKERIDHEAELNKAKKEHEAWIKSENKKLDDSRAILETAKEDQRIEGIKLKNRADKVKEAAAAQVRALTGLTE